VCLLLLCIFLVHVVYRRFDELTSFCKMAEFFIEIKTGSVLCSFEV
jgi:hypothetical protein